MPPITAERGAAARPVPRVGGRRPRLTTIGRTTAVLATLIASALGPAGGARAEGFPSSRDGAVISPAESGQDISWPQCSTAQGGYGLPLPGPEATFVIIGLSKGLGFTENPCVTDQVAWARSRHVKVASYVVASYPNNTEYATYGGSGPYPTDTVEGRLKNVGRAEALAWLAVKRRAGLVTPTVWVDVEPRTARPWTDRPTDRNIPVLRGIIDTLTAAGFQAGIYTNPSGWQAITGGVRWGMVEWRTVGKRTREEALATCNAAGLQGSPVLMAQYWTDTADYDVLCPAMNAYRKSRYLAQY